MKVALLGCGKIAYWHISALKDIKSAQLCAVCDRDIYQAHQASDWAGGTNTYDNFSEMLQKESPDVVHILTPPSFHADTAIEAMNSGCHVFIEKPMALSVQDAERMVEASIRNGVKMSTCHNILFTPSVLKAFKHIKNGDIGDIVYVDSFYGLSNEGGDYKVSGGKTHWAWNLPGGPFTNFLPHLIYLQLALLEKFKGVSDVVVARASGVNKPVTELTVMLEGEQSTGIMNFSMRANPYVKFLDIYGTKGILHVDIVREICVFQKLTHLPNMVSKLVFALESSSQLAFSTLSNTVKVFTGKMKSMMGLRILLKEFYASLESGNDLPVTGMDGQKMVEVMEDIWNISKRKNYSFTMPKKIETQYGEPISAIEKDIFQKGGIKKKVLITGGTGYLGKYLFEALIRNGADVTLLVRNAESVSASIASKAKLIQGDVRDKDSLELATQGMDIVYHCAAVTVNSAKWSDHYAVNVQGTHDILEASEKSGVGKVIVISSVVVYGVDSPLGGRTVSEDSPLDKKPNYWGFYLRSKLEGDRAAIEFQKKTKMDVVIVRPGILYGTGKSELPGRNPTGIVVGNGKNPLPYAYVSNVVDLLLLAGVSTDPDVKVVNVVDDEQPSIREFCTVTNRYTGVKTRILAFPPIIFNGISLFFEFLASMQKSEKPPKFNRFIFKSIYRNIRYETAIAKNKLGWTPEISLEEGVKRVLSEEN